MKKYMNFFGNEGNWRIGTHLGVKLTCHVELIHALPAGFLCHHAEAP